MRLIAKHTLRPRHRTGFTLPELTVVFAVIGVVIGSIWVAASQVNRNNLIDTATQELTAINTNVRELYAGQNTASLLAKGFAALTPLLISQGVFPPEMLFCTTGPTTYVGNAWNAVGACAAIGTTNMTQIEIKAAVPGKPSQFGIKYVGVPEDGCTSLVSHNSTPGLDTRLTEIDITNSTILAPKTTKYVIGGTTIPCTMIGSATCLLPPPSIADVATGCSGTPPFAVEWFYNLGG